MPVAPNSREQGAAGTSTIGHTSWPESADSRRRPRSGTVTPGVDLVTGTNVELNSLPRDFLDSFPYPAFVLVTAVPPTQAEHSGPWAPMTYENIHALTPVWCNQKWARLTRRCMTKVADGDSEGNASLLDLLSLQGARQLGAWVMEGQYPRTATDKPQTSRLGITLTPPPVGRVTPTIEREVSPLDDDCLDEEEAGSPHSTIALEFTFGSSSGDRPIVFELTKTTQIMYVWRKLERAAVGTHRFTVITAFPRTDIPSTSPSLLSPSSTVLMSPTSTELLLPTSPPTAPALSPPTLVDVDPVPSLVNLSLSPERSTVPLADSLEVNSSTTQTNSTDFEYPPRQVLINTEPLIQHSDAIRLMQEGGIGQSLFFLRGGDVKRSLSTQPNLSVEYANDVNMIHRTKDWSKTPVGPESQWPADLNCMLGILKSVPMGSALWWGEDMTFFYNQSYSEHLRDHPRVYGESGTTSWAELWTTLGALTEVVLSGASVFKEDDFVLRKQVDSAALFETYRSQMWAPFRLDGGRRFGGVVHSVMETTTRVLAERRSGLLRELQEHTVNARTVDEFYSGILEVLEDSPRDAPFALLFTVEPLNEHSNAPARRRTMTSSLVEQVPIRAKVRYVGGVGVPDNHHSAPPVTDVTIPPKGDPSNIVLAEAFSNPTLQTGVSLSPTPSLKRSGSSHGVSSPSVSSHGLRPESSSGPLNRERTQRYQPETPTYADTPDEAQWPFAFDLHSGRPVLIEDCSALIVDYPIRVWDEAPKSAIVIPILRNTEKDVPVAVLVLGLSCRLPFDASYEEFIHLIRSQMATQLAAIRGYQADQLRIEELGTLDRARSALFSNVAHELFTPLTLVSGPIDDAIVDLDSGPIRDGLVIARRNARRLTRLVSILRDVSNLEAGRLRGTFKLVNLGELTRDSATLFHKAAGRSNLEYTVECDTTQHDIYVDCEKWDKILFSLIGNAINYTLEGSVQVILEYIGNEAVLTVKDTGVGIPSSDLQLVGEQCYRGSTHGKHDGSGVTLPLAKQLIEMHKGVLEVESKSQDETVDGSHGTTFRVRIPLGKAHLPPDSIAMSGISDPHGAVGWELAAETVDDLFGDGSGTASADYSVTASRRDSNLDPGPPRSATPPILTQTCALDEALAISAAAVLAPLSPVASIDHRDRKRGKRSSRVRGIDPSTLWFDPSDVVMVVDDLDDTRRYLQSILSPFCRVVEARDGVESLEKFETTQPDLIISELMLPRLSGFELLRSLRAGTKEQRVVPFLMLTSTENARPDDALAADDLLSKPFNARELVARAHLQLQLGKKRRAMERLFEQRTQELRAITDSSPVGFFRCTMDGYVTYANAAWYELSGYPPDAVVINWGDYVSEQDQARIRAIWEEYIRTDAPQCSADWQWMNGRYVSTKVIRLDSKAGDGRPLGSIGCAIEVTDRILHEKLQKQRIMEAEQRRAEAEEAKFQQELLIDITSHEIRNPISSLMQMGI